MAAFGNGVQGAVDSSSHVEARNLSFSATSGSVGRYKQKDGPQSSHLNTMGTCVVLPHKASKYKQVLGHGMASSTCWWNLCVERVLKKLNPTPATSKKEKKRTIHPSFTTTLIHPPSDIQHLLLLPWCRYCCLVEEPWADHNKGA